MVFRKWPRKSLIFIDFYETSTVGILARKLLLSLGNLNFPALFFRLENFYLNFPVLFFGFSSLRSLYPKYDILGEFWGLKFNSIDTYSFLSAWQFSRAISFRSPNVARAAAAASCLGQVSPNPRFDAASSILPLLDKKRVSCVRFYRVSKQFLGIRNFQRLCFKISIFRNYNFYELRALRKKLGELGLLTFCDWAFFI